MTVLSISEGPKTRNIEVEFQGLLRRIEDEDNKGKWILSPIFSVGGARFRIEVVPEWKVGNIGVFLSNQTEEDQSTSVQVKHASGRMGSWEKADEPRKGKVWGFAKFMTHKDYKSWAAENGDTLKLEVSVTLHVKDKPAPEVPVSLSPDYAVTSINRPIMMDEDTADFSLRCQTKTFRVHRNFLCNGSPVLRAMILGPMEEAAKGEAIIEDLNEDTLDSLITFIYTGDFQISPVIDVQNMVLAGDKYLMSEFTELFFYKLQHEDIKPKIVADILLASHKYSNKKLKELAVEKIRANRDILDDEDFRKTLTLAVEKIRANRDF